MSSPIAAVKLAVAALGIVVMRRKKRSTGVGGYTQNPAMRYSRISCAQQTRREVSPDFNAQEDRQSEARRVFGTITNKTRS